MEESACWSVRVSPGMIPGLVGLALLAASAHASSSLDSGLQVICEWTEHNHWVEGRCLDTGEYLDHLRAHYGGNIWNWR